MPAKKKQQRCQEKNKTTRKRCQRAAVYRANGGSVVVCGTHARGHADAVRL